MSDPNIHPGLPPVTPPSGRFIAQLFIVPGLIVFLAVTVFAAFYYLFSPQTGYTPEKFLDRLDSPNADLRWRAASDLAQILKRPEQGSLKWKADPRFALALAERLETALDDLAKREAEVVKKQADLPAESKELAWRTISPQRDHVRFLAAALGDFHVPVGAPLLCQMSLNTASPDVAGNTLRRRQAVWALSNLGENTRGFKKLSAEQQAEILATLKTEAAAVTGSQRGKWARSALAYLDPAQATDDVVKVDEVLAKVAEADDPYLREQVALAFNFWPGPQAEPTLLRLSQDDGHGTLLRITEPE